MKKFREIEDSLLEETKNLSYDSDSEEYFEEIDFDQEYSINGKYRIPVNGTYFIVEKRGNRTIQAKKDDVVILKQANSISRIK